MTAKTPPEIRFWRHVQKGETKECWPWLGEKTHHGYGRFAPHPTTIEPGMKKAKRYLSHRLAWEYSNGKKIPDGLEACHECDNRPCCNPEHIFIGTHQSNMDDCRNKGRLNTQRGSRQGNAKLTEKQVVQIRLMYKPGLVTFPMIGKLFVVSADCIGLIVRRKAWRHVP